MKTGKHSFRDYVNFKLDQVSRIAREKADHVYQRHCGLDVWHIRVLRLVSEKPGLAVNSIVQEAMLDRSVVSRIISSLARQRLIKRTISPLDARQVLLAPTAAGKGRVGKANALGDALNLDLLHMLDAREIEMFERCLEKLAKWRPSETRDSASDANKSRVREGKRLAERQTNY